MHVTVHSVQFLFPLPRKQLTNCRLSASAKGSRTQYTRDKGTVIQTKQVRSKHPQMQYYWVEIKFYCNPNKHLSNASHFLNKIYQVIHNWVKYYVKALHSWPQPHRSSSWPSINPWPYPVTPTSSTGSPNLRHCPVRTAILRILYVHTTCLNSAGGATSSASSSGCVVGDVLLWRLNRLFGSTLRLMCFSRTPRITSHSSSWRHRPANKRYPGKRKINHDTHFVWFPCKMDFSHHESPNPARVDCDEGGIEKSISHGKPYKINFLAYFYILMHFILIKLNTLCKVADHENHVRWIYLTTVLCIVEGQKYARICFGPPLCTIVGLNWANQELEIKDARWQAQVRGEPMTQCSVVQCLDPDNADLTKVILEINRSSQW